MRGEGESSKAQRPDERSEESATGRGTKCRRVMEEERLLKSRRLVFSNTLIFKKSKNVVFIVALYL